MSRRKQNPSRIFAETGKFEESGYAIRKRCTHNGKEYIQVDLRTRRGKRIRKQTDDEGKPFQTLSQAITYCRQKRVSETNFGTEARRLSDRDRVDAVAARRLLGNTTILQAAEYYVRNHGGPAIKKELKEVSEEYFEHLRAKQRRQSTIKGYQDKLRAFLNHFEEKAACDIARADIEDWVQSNNWNPQNEKHYLTVTRGFFEFARKKGYITENPCTEIDKPTIEPCPPEIQTPSQISTLFREACKLEDAHKIIPYLSLHYFAGLRPQEALLLDWKNVLFDDDILRVGADIAKARRQRLVELSPNLKRWLIPYRKKHGQICPLKHPTLRRRFRKAAKNAKIDMAYDAGRHAFASYHLAAYQDPARTSLQLGHSRPDLLFTTYRGLVTKKAAATFWKIGPPRAKGNLVHFPKQAG